MKAPRSSLSLRPLTTDELEFLEVSILSKIGKYIPFAVTNRTDRPSPKQALFLVLPHKEAYYGGAAGGGKSDALLMAALQFIDVPGYSAIIFRRSLQDLKRKDALLDRAHEWLDHTDAHWNGKDYRWTFPSGATLDFGYMETARDKEHYQSAQYQFIGLDEVTDFKRADYTFLFSRLRRLKGSLVPTRMRSASNPIGVGRAWVYHRFVNPKTVNKPPFIFALAHDNPGLDYDDYMASLDELDPVTKQRLKDGDWSAVERGEKFDRTKLKKIQRKDVPKLAGRCRFWDIAATEPKVGEDPDYTDGALFAEQDGLWYIEHNERFQGSPYEVEKRIKEVTKSDKDRSKKLGYYYEVAMEQEPAASGKTVVDHYARVVLKGYNFYPMPSTGSKEIRANPFSAAVGNGLVHIVDAYWTEEYLMELDVFPLGDHDDSVDASSGAFTRLSEEVRSDGGFFFG